MYLVLKCFEDVWTKLRLDDARFVWSMLHMKPGLMWMGQEAFGISLFDSKKRLGHLGSALAQS